MWVIRTMLLVVLGALVGADSFLLRYRKKYPRLVENRIINIAIVVAHLVVTYALVTLPPAAGWNARPVWLQDKSVCGGFVATGAALVGMGIVLALLALKQRRAIGLQGAPEGLVTSHVYRYFRHPICTGVLWISLGLALLTRNPDGLMVLPAIFVAYLTQVLLEERDDLEVRFREQYPVYRQTTRMFGPAWLWSGILVAILLIAVSAWI